MKVLTAPTALALIAAMHEIVKGESEFCTWEIVHNPTGMSILIFNSASEVIGEVKQSY
jgi:hypothetical protein